MTSKKEQNSIKIIQKTKRAKIWQMKGKKIYSWEGLKNKVKKMWCKQ